jgi:hypothetical protein
LKYERLDQANYLLGQQYYLPDNSRYGKDVVASFLMFRCHLGSLENRNKRLELRRLSLHADLLKERCGGTGIDFRYLLQADFIAFMRAEIEAKSGRRAWWPETLGYLGDFNHPFEIFARSISKTYFDKAKILLCIESASDLFTILNGYQDGSRKLPSWGFDSFNPAVLLGYERLATLP